LCRPRKGTFEAHDWSKGAAYVPRATPCARPPEAHQSLNAEQRLAALMPGCRGLLHQLSFLLAR
jgi:hypothetical protein